MDKEQQEEIRKHVKSNARRLGEVIATENLERRKIKGDLDKFHKVVNERKKEIKEMLDYQHNLRMDELDEQVEKLKSQVFE